MFVLLRPVWPAQSKDWLQISIILGDCGRPDMEKIIQRIFIEVLSSYSLTTFRFWIFLLPFVMLPAITHFKTASLLMVGACCPWWKAIRWIFIQSQQSNLWSYLVRSSGVQPRHQMVLDKQWLARVKKGIKECFAMVGLSEKESSEYIFLKITAFEETFVLLFRLLRLNHGIWRNMWKSCMQIVQYYSDCTFHWSLTVRLTHFCHQANWGLQSTTASMEIWSSFALWTEDNFKTNILKTKI